jgi:predicted N-acetyltransferase YhbS
VTEIRRARSADASRLASLTVQLGYPVTADAMADRLATMLDLARDLILVSCDDQDQAVGWIHVCERQLLEADDYCEIAGLIVDSAHRRGGRAARLVAAAERWVRARGHARITVHSNIVRAESHPFYERVGYARVKTQHVYQKALG